jgi:TRAP-type C4-dicarboxylate transport system permease small subunit
MQFLQAFNTKMNKILCGIMFFSFTLMVILTFLQVIFRYCIEQPLAWSEEGAKYLFMWATYTGASIAFYEGKHINVTLLTDLFSTRVKAALYLLADACCLWFLSVFVYQGFIVSQRVFALGQFSPSLPWLPIGVTYLAIPVGCLFMFCNVLAYAIRHSHTMVTGEGGDVYDPHEI